MYRTLYEAGMYQTALRKRYFRGSRTVARRTVGRRAAKRWHASSTSEIMGAFFLTCRFGANVCWA